LADAGLEPESEGFGQIFEAQHRQLFRLALLLTGGDRCLSEDVVGQVFLATLPKWRKGTVAEPGSYLRRAVVNQVNGAFRRRGTERRGALRVAVTGEGTSPGEAAIDDRDLLWSALRALPPKQRSAVVLRYYEDLSEGETARVLGVSVGTVKSQTARGLAKLRNALGETDNG
jgi:RNA polymerase sigma-70 factor (sigma-E family)